MKATKLTFKFPDSEKVFTNDVTEEDESEVLKSIEILFDLLNADFVTIE